MLNLYNFIEPYLKVDIQEIKPNVDFLNKLKDLNESRDELLKKDVEHEQEITQEVDLPDVENMTK